MSTSAARSEAARRNGARSNGPVTAEGKVRSSQNSQKHGILSRIQVLCTEDQQTFDELLIALTNEHKPSTPTEQHYVSEMADAAFRLQRIRDHSRILQNKKINELSVAPDSNTAAEAFQQLSESGVSLQLLHRYESQFRRQFDKSLQMLLQLRAASNKAEKDAGAHFTKLLKFMADEQPAARTTDFPHEPKQPPPAFENLAPKPSPWKLSRLFKS